jgi:hypothetical protein
MAWTVMQLKSPVIRVNYSKGRILWNEATQRLLRYPGKVNVIYNQSGGELGLISGHVYRVVPEEDGDYRVTVGKSDLAAAGLDLENPYEAEATLVVRQPDGPEPLDGLVTIPYPE